MRLTLTEEEHRQRGRESNIPECCIEFFIQEWPAYDTYYKRHKHFKKYPREVEYVACPACIAGKTFNKLRITE